MAGSKLGVYDGLRSVVAEVKGDGTGTVTSSRKFDVFGSVRGGTNPSGTSKQKFVGGLGHVSDDETGYVYMRARYMDPTTGRFVSEDPSRDKSNHSTNWYLYVTDDPENGFDRTGKFDEKYYLFGLPGWELGLQGSNDFRVVAASFLENFIVYLVPWGGFTGSSGPAFDAYMQLNAMLGEAKAQGPAVSSVAEEAIAFTSVYSAMIWIAMAFLDVEDRLPN